jgi:HPt (histidine-containing phosphotransfer) domain-containing protein
MDSGEFDTMANIGAYLRKEFELGDEDVAEMQEEYGKNIALLADKAAAELAGSAWDDLKRSGHSIKGASANVGANVISAAGKELEQAALAKDVSACSAALAKINALREKL